MDKIAANNDPANNKKRKSQRDETPYLYVRAAAVSKNSLNSETEKLKCRMDHVGNMHLLIKSTATKPVCACHRWAGGRTCRVAGAIVMCKVCLVSLCIDCLDKFHTLADVEELRRSVTN